MLSKDKITAIDYIGKALGSGTCLHIQNLVEGYAEARQVGKILKTNRGYATAVNQAIGKLQAKGKIIIVDYWFVKFVK